MARNYERKSPDSGGLTPEQLNGRKQSRFIRELLENGGFVERAIRACSTSRRWLNDNLESDAEFAALYQTIRDQNNEKIEEEIYRRAVVGNEKPLSYQGKLTGHSVREYSDNLLMFLAKANMPAKYRDNYKEGNISDEELDERIRAWYAKRGDSKGKILDEVAEEVSDAAM